MSKIGNKRGPMTRILRLNDSFPYSRPIKQLSNQPASQPTSQPTNQPTKQTNKQTNKVNWTKQETRSSRRKCFRMKKKTDKLSCRIQIVVVEGG